jgi:hypothetical protein
MVKELTLGEKGAPVDPDGNAVELGDLTLNLVLPLSWKDSKDMPEAMRKKVIEVGEANGLDYFLITETSAKLPGEVSADSRRLNPEALENDSRVHYALFAPLKQERYELHTAVVNYYSQSGQ